MQLFFNTPATIAHSILRYADWNYVRSGLQRNLGTVKQYYHSRVMTTKSNHLIARIINTGDISHNHEIERYYDLLDMRSNAISNALQMTSPVSKGRLFDGVFYGPGSTEIIIANQDSFNPVTAYKNWRTLSPVTVVTHPRSDLGLMLPNGKQTGTETGLAIISINIPMLFIQWRGFADEQIYMNNEESIGLQGVPHFVHRYVLPGMLDTHLDIAVFNRMMNLVNGAPMGISTRNHPFTLVDYTSKVMVIQERILKDLQERKMDYMGILEMIPAVTKNNMREALVVPNIVPTRQIAWVELVSRLDAILAVVKIGGDDAFRMDIALINNLAIEFRLAMRNKSLSALPYDLAYDAYSKMNQIAGLVGKRLINY